MQAKKPVTGSTTNAAAKAKASTTTSTAKTTVSQAGPKVSAVKTQQEVVGKTLEKKPVEPAKKSSVVGTAGTKDGPPKSNVNKAPAIVSKEAKGDAKKASGIPEKKAEKTEEQPKPIAMPVHEIKLPAVEILCKEIVARNKTPLILDKTGNFFTFLKYKGNLCDFQEFEIKKGMGKTSREDFLELIRTRLVVAMKVGNNCALFIDKGLNNLGEFFKGVDFFKIPESLIPEKIKEEKYFKANVLKPEEDVDGFGNKGGFRLHEDFLLTIVANGDDEEKLKQNLGLPLHLFELIKIVE